jgi:hypothetical protein
VGNLLNLNKFDATVRLFEGPWPLAASANGGPARLEASATGHPVHWATQCAPAAAAFTLAVA